MPTVVGGVTYYRFPASTWITSGTTVGVLANANVALYPNETATTAMSVLTVSGQPFTPQTDANGILPDFLAPQFDDVIAEAGARRQNIRSSEIAERIETVAATASQQALDVLTPEINAVKQDPRFSDRRLPRAGSVTPNELAPSALQALAQILTETVNG